MAKATGPGPDQKELEKRRLKAIRLFERGVTPAEAARRLEVHRQSATRWRSAWLAGGREALVSKGKTGRKCALTESQLEELAGLLTAGAVAAGYPNEMWTLPRVADLIRERFGVKYHPGHVWHLLSGLGFSCQRPARRAVERDDEKVLRWKRYKWPALKKKPAARGE